MIRMNDDYWAGHYLLEAAKRYSEWGALAKVDHMTSINGYGHRVDFSSLSAKTDKGTALRGRTQYDKSMDAVADEKRLRRERESLISNSSSRAPLVMGYSSSSMTSH